MRRVVKMLQKLISSFFVLLFLVSLVSVSAADVKVVLQTDKQTYKVGEEITITILLEAEGKAYPFDVVGPNVVVESSNPLALGFRNARDGGVQTIYPRHLLSGPKQAKGWEIISPLNIVSVTAANNVLGSFVVPVIDADDNLQFVVSEESTISYGMDRAGNLLSYSVNTPALTVSTACDGDCADVVAQTSGGGGCIPGWSCTGWKVCKNGKQERNCNDLNKCQKPKIEERDCVCVESWVCSDWSGCSNNKQQRTCVDEHACGTIISKPELQKNCGASDSGAQPAKLSNKLETVPKQIQKPSEVGEPTSNNTYLIVGGVVLVLAAIGGLVYYLKFRPPTSPSMPSVQQPPQV